MPNILFRTLSSANKISVCVTQLHIFQSFTVKIKMTLTYVEIKRKA